MKHNLKDMTHVEFAAAMQTPRCILIPLGSVEEQGPHAPMGDFMLVEKLAALAAEQADGITTPVLPFGYADFFRSIQGGMQLRPATFCAVLEDMLTGFLDHGHERLLVFNGHTTNSTLIDQVARKLRAERGVMIPWINVWRLVPESLWSALFGEEAARVRGHGGEPMASVYAHLFPDLMRPDLRTRRTARNNALGLPIRGILGARFEEGEVQMPIDCHEVDPSGVLGGHSEAATAERGKALADHIVGYTARLMRHLAQQDPRLSPQPALQENE